MTNILILGGTIFLGPALCRAIHALYPDARITLYHRGNHKPTGFFADKLNTWVEQGIVEIMYGDRNDDLTHLAERHSPWSAVIDTCGYMPSVVEHTCKAFAHHTNCYVFISSVSAYEGFDADSITEEFPTFDCSGDIPTTLTNETYGLLKSACECVVKQYMGNKALIIRPGLIVGIQDPTDRFTYWVWRTQQALQERSAMLIPKECTQPIQYIDVEDCAIGIAHLINVHYYAPETVAGEYNFVVPSKSVILQDILDATARLLNYQYSDIPVVSMPNATLLEYGLVPWGDLPLWIPESLRELRGMHEVSAQKILTTLSSKKFSFRPVEQTVQTILDELKERLERTPDMQCRAGMSKERETEIIEQYTRTKL